MIKYLVFCIAAPLLSALSGGILSRIGLSLPPPRERNDAECVRASFYSFSVSSLLCLFSLVAAILALIDGYGILTVAFFLIFSVCFAVAWSCFACVSVLDADGNALRRRDIFMRWRDCRHTDGAEIVDGVKSSRKRYPAAYIAVYLTVAALAVCALCLIAVSGRPYQDIREERVVFSDYSEAEGVLFPVRADNADARYFVLDYRERASNPSRLIAEIAEGREFGIKYAVLYDDKWEGQYVVLEIVGEDGSVYLQQSDAMEQRSDRAAPAIISLGIMSVIWIALGAWLLFLSDSEKLARKIKRERSSGRSDSLNK